MNGFTSFMEKYFMPVAGKIGSQKHLVAIRDSFIAIMPIIMVGSIAVLLNVFLRDLPTQWGFTNFVEAMQPLIAINGNVYFGSITILALCFVFALGYNVAQTYEVNPIAGGVIAFAALVACMNQNAAFDYTLTGVPVEAINTLKDFGMNVALSEKGDAVILKSVTEWGYMAAGYCGSSGLFTALIVGLISSMIYVKLMIKKVTLKLPDTVPPAVSKAFAAIIPGVIAVYVAAIASQIMYMTTGLYINDWVVEFIQKPLLGMSQGFVSVIVVTFLQQLFWFFGLHGSNILAPIVDGVYLTAQTQNLEIMNRLHDASQMPYMWVRGSFDAYCMMGGSGVTLGLLISILFFSKREDSKAIAKLATPMGVFNINEPVIFGLPIVLNPLYLIPWLIVPPICAMIGYAATAVGLVPPVYVTVPWVMPVGIYATLATGGNLMAGAVAIFNLFVSFIIWTPFVLLANRVKPEETEEEDDEDAFSF